MAKSKHLHKYKKVKLGKDKDYLVYRCMRPDCPHYITPELVVGKLAACFICDSSFIITADMVRSGREMLKLKCKNCVKTKDEHHEVPAESIDSFLTNLGIGKVDE